MQAVHAPIRVERIEISDQKLQELYYVDPTLHKVVNYIRTSNFLYDNIHRQFTCKLERPTNGSILSIGVQQTGRNVIYTAQAECVMSGMASGTPNCNLYITIYMFEPLLKLEKKIGAVVMNISDEIAVDNCWLYVSNVNDEPLMGNITKYIQGRETK